MHSFDFDVFLADHPVFSLEQLAAVRGDERNQGSARNQLKHHLATGRIKAVARGVYALVPPGLDAQNIYPMPSWWLRQLVRMGSSPTIAPSSSWVRLTPCGTNALSTATGAESP